MMANLLREPHPLRSIAITLIGPEGEHHDEPQVDVPGDEDIAEGNERQAHHGGCQDDERGQAKEDPVGVGRHGDLL